MMTTNNPHESENSIPFLSEEMEWTLRRLAWRDEIFREALIADPKEIIQYLFHQNLPNGKLPDDLTIKVVEQDPFTRHIVLPVLAEEEPIFEIAEEQQVDLIANLGFEGKMRSGESDKSNQSNEAKGKRRVGFTEADARRRDKGHKRDTQSRNESFPSTREFDKMVVDAYTRDSNFRQELKENATRAIESRFAQFFPDGKIPKERIYKVLQDTVDLHHIVLSSSPSSHGESRPPELDHKAIAKQADKNIRRDESVVVTCTSDRCGNNDDSMCVSTCLSCN